MPCEDKPSIEGSELTVLQSLCKRHCNGPFIDESPWHISIPTSQIVNVLLEQARIIEGLRTKLICLEVELLKVK